MSCNHKFEHAYNGRGVDLKKWSQNSGQRKIYRGDMRVMLNSLNTQIKYFKIILRNTFLSG